MSSGSAPPSAVRSWSAVAYGARWAPPNTKPRRFRRRPRRASRSSPTWWPRQSRTPTRARRWSGSPRSRPRCGGSRRWSRRGPRRPRSSTPSPRRWSGCSDADGVALNRYEPDDEVTVVAHRGLDAARSPPGTRVSHEGENVTLNGAAHRAARPDGELRAARRRPCGACAHVGCARERRSADRRRRPAVGRRSIASWKGERVAAGRHRGADGPVRRSCSTPRSRTPTAATSSRPRGRVCSPPATRPAAASCATCTTARSSGWCTPS